MILCEDCPLLGKCIELIGPLDDCGVEHYRECEIYSNYVYLRKLFDQDRAAELAVEACFESDDIVVSEDEED